MIYEAKVYDKDGKLTKTVSSKDLIEKLWKDAGKSAKHYGGQDKFKKAPYKLGEGKKL